MSEKVIRISASVKLPLDDHCHTCGYGPLDGATGVAKGTEAELYDETGGHHDINRPPSPMMPAKGSISICGRCGELMIFDVDTEGRMGIRLPVDAELAELKRDADNWALLERLRDNASQRRHWGNFKLRNQT